MWAAALPRAATRRAIGRARPAAAALLAAVGAGPAAARDDRPLEMPTRDVSVAYRMVGGGLPEQTEIRMSWLVAENRVRIDFPFGLWSVVDQKNTRDSFMAVVPMRAVMPMPDGAAGAGGLPGLPSDAYRAATRYARAGTAAYAGHACTVWRYENERRGAGEACITEDGVLLRGAGTLEGVTGAVEATRVAYEPQDPARFRRPEGYRMMQPPPVPPGMFGR